MDDRASIACESQRRQDASIQKVSILDSILIQMNKRAVSQRDLARHLKISEAYVSMLLRYPFNPTLKTLQKLCDFLDLRIMLK